MNDSEKTICPRCAALNRCALAIDPQAQNCWCFAQPIGASSADNSAHIDSGASCYCANCLREIQESRADARRPLQNDA